MRIHLPGVNKYTHSNDNASGIVVAHSSSGSIYGDSKDTMMQTELDLWPPLWEYSLACTKKFHVVI